MKWDVPYVVSDSLALQISPAGTFVARTAETPQPRALDEDALPLLTSFAAPTTPRAALEKLRESWEIDDDAFAMMVDTMLRESLLVPAGEERSAPRRDLFLILGVSRSGTSALTKALAACGVALDFEQPSLPLGAWKDDKSRTDGGYETYEILPLLDFVRSIVFRYGGDEASTTLTDEIVLTAGEALGIRGLLELIPRFPFAIKDPLLTFQFPQWKEIARQCRPAISARPVVSLRHPLASAHALVNRGYCKSLRTGLDRWCRYYTEVRFLIDAGHEPLIVVYDGRKDRFVAQIEALCEILSLPFDRDRVSDGFVPSGADRPDEAEFRRSLWGRGMKELYEDLEARAVTAEVGR